VQQLGDTDDVVVATKKRKISGVKEPVVSDEALKSAKKMSKAAQKRFGQIEIRKEKEAKLTTYHKILKDNQINESHRSLLLSTRDIGQKHSQRELLKRLLKRHRAGLELTAEEHDTLFPYGTEHGDITHESPVLTDISGIFPNLDSAENVTLTYVEDVKVTENDVSPVSGFQQENDSPIGISDFSLDLLSVVSGGANTKAAAGPFKHPEAAGAVSKVSFGASLKDQLSKLKSVTKEVAVTVVPDAEVVSDLETVKPYVPVKIYVPAMSGNESLLSVTPPLRPDSKSTNSTKLGVVPVFRDSSIQVIFFMFLSEGSMMLSALMNFRVHECVCLFAGWSKKLLK
jgi:hypothetical protein